MKGLSAWYARRAMVALAMEITVRQADLVLPFVGVPWRGPRFLLAGAMALAVGALCASLVVRQERRSRRRAERERAARLGLQALARELR